MSDTPSSPEAQAARLQQIHAHVDEPIRAQSVPTFCQCRSCVDIRYLLDLLLTQQQALEEAQRAADCPMLMCPYEKRAEAAEAQVATLTAALTDVQRAHAGALSHQRTLRADTTRYKTGIEELRAALIALVSGEPQHFTGCTCVSCGVRSALSASPVTPQNK